MIQHTEITADVYIYITRHRLIVKEEIDFMMLCRNSASFSSSKKITILFNTNTAAYLMAEGHIRDCGMMQYEVTDSGIELYNKLNKEVALIEELMKL